GIDLFGGLLADVAGVEQDDVGFLHPHRLGAPRGTQKLAHALAVVDVHLAAERLDVDLPADLAVDRLADLAVDLLCNFLWHWHRPIASLARALEGHAVEFELMADEAEAQITRHPLLQALDILVAELDHLAAFDIDEVVVMAARRLLVAAAAGPEVVALQE